MERRILSDDELSAAVGRLDGWEVDGRVLKKKLKFDDFAHALSYINRVATLAEEIDHHPDITFGWGYAELALTTHDRGGITDVDIVTASRIDNIGVKSLP